MRRELKFASCFPHSVFSCLTTIFLGIALFVLSRVSYQRYRKFRIVSFSSFAITGCFPCRCVLAGRDNAACDGGCASGRG